MDQSFASNATNDNNEADIKSRIKDISDRIAMTKIADTAGDHRNISASIGSETPLGVLTEIREYQGRTLDMLKHLGALEEERQKKDDIRHRELCTILLGMTQGYTSRAGSVAGDSMMGTPTSSGMSKSSYYYGATTITSGTHLISCVMMHLDMMILQHPYFRKISSTDSTFMDIKEWYVLCNNVINADKNSKTGLRIPKPSDEDFKSACRIVASPVVGRRPSCDPDQISILLTDSPGLMNTVDWVRSSLLKCNGMLSPERYFRFKHFAHPFIDDGRELKVEMPKKIILPNRSYHQQILELKVTKKKEYMRQILELDTRPMDALAVVNQS